MIPKVIHYCWFGGKSLPKSVKKCIKSWRKLCPDYKIIEWNESNFDVHSHPFMQRAYEAKAWAFVSDYARLKVVYDNGGIYLDTDVELLRNLDFLLTNECYVGIQQCEKLCATGLGFGAIKANPVIKKMMDKYDELQFDLQDKENLACPYINNKVISGLGYSYDTSVVKLEDVTVYPPYFFDPVAPGDSENLLCKDSVSIHHYAASWTSYSNSIKRKICILIGQKRINLIKRFLRRNR